MQRTNASVLTQHIQQVSWISSSYNSNYTKVSNHCLERQVCGGRPQAIQGQQNVIYSHPQFDGTTTYARNEDCEWLIEAGHEHKVQIDFTYFALENEANCQYDSVEGKFKNCRTC